MSIGTEKEKTVDTKCRKCGVRVTLRDIPRGLVKMGWRGWGFTLGFSGSLTLMVWGIWGFVETFR